ncbi:unnamed protein product [Paramecium pentaurelia]|uniref:Alpha-carbonic anhydrase domain-containing protein n=1 Tax=Paramecium pentaurelia TaxID=43138 RepID=A0A8S1TL30_9CILI|nr:unnamed protein product [Paramecium pentaurelia]
MFYILLVISQVYSQDEYICGKGERQSPISITDTFDAKYYKLELRFKDDILVGQREEDTENKRYIFTDDPDRQIPEFRMLGHDPHGLMVGYRPTEFQLIAPAEHQIFEQSFDLELVIWGDLLNIYKNPNIKGGLSFFFKIINQDEISQENNTVITYPQIFNLTEDDDQLSINMINLASHLKHNDKYITYRGSLTWGNCDEIVDRFLIPQVFPITQDQYDQIVSVKYINNANPLQEIRKRRIVRGTLIIEDETSANYNPIYRFLSLTFIAFLFFLIFALFIKEQREKRRMDQAKKFKSGN